MSPPVPWRLLAWIIPTVLTVVLLLIVEGLTPVRWSGPRMSDRCDEGRRPRMSIDEMARCAATGSVRSQITYGEELFRAGQRTEAETWFEAAVAGSGSAFAKGETANSVAMRLDRDWAKPGPGEVDAAERWYRRAFELGSDRAAVLLGLRLKRNSDQEGAELWFGQAVERSGGQMATMIASNLTGRSDRPQTADEAIRRVRWLQRGAELGNLGSMSYYAEALTTGRGVERSETEAFRWYEAAAQHPHAGAWDLIKLAELHADGKGTPPDLAAAAAVLSAAKGAKRDSSDTLSLERIKSLEKRLAAAGTAGR